MELYNHIGNFKFIFESGLFPGASDQEALDRVKAKYKVGDIINFRSGNKAEVLDVLPEGLRVVGPGPDSDQEVGVIPWNALGAIARLGMVEAKLFPGADDTELKKRRYKPKPTTYKEWAEREGLSPRKAEVFDAYMQRLWGMKHLNRPYGREWLERFDYNYAFGASDLDGQEILKELGVKKGIDTYNGDVVDLYVDTNEAYAIHAELTPDDLPYTNEDIIQTTEYKAIMNVPGTRDITSDLQKRRRGLVVEFVSSESTQWPLEANTNEASRLFPGADDKEMRLRKKEWRDAQPKREREDIIYELRQKIQYESGKRVYALYANGYVRSVSMGFGGHTTTGVITKLPVAITLDGYRVLLARLKKIIDRKIKAVVNMKKKLAKLLAEDQPVSEASRLFPGADDKEMDNRRAEYTKEILARKKKMMEDPDTWQAIAKRELEQMLEVETEIEDSIDFDNEEFLLTALFDSKGNNGERQWLVYKDDTIAEYEAEKQVEDMIETSPESFTQSWLEDYMYMSETDKNMSAQEEADALADDMSAEDLLIEASGDFEEEYDALQNKIDALYELDPVPADFKDRLHDLTEEQERIIDDLREQYRDHRYDEILGELENPIEYFVDTLGIYTMEELFKAPFMQIETDKAATDAVATDGAAHFLDSYDGEAVELPSGAIAMGR